MHNPFRRLVIDESVTLSKVESVRAMYQDKETQYVEMTLTAESGEKVTYTVSTILARELIEQLTYSYYAIVPPVKNRNQGFA